MRSREHRLLAWAASTVLLVTTQPGCATILVKEWKNDRSQVPTRVTEVEGWRASPTVVTLRVVDRADDGEERERLYAWVHGAWPAGESASVAAILSRSCVEPLVLDPTPDGDHSALLQVSPSVAWPRLPGLPDHASLPVVRPRTAEASSDLLLRGDQLELWAEGRWVKAVTLPTGDWRPLADDRERRERVAWLLFPVALTLDLVTSPVQFVGVLVYLAVCGPRPRGK